MAPTKSNCRLTITPSSPFALIAPVSPRAKPIAIKVLAYFFINAPLNA